MISLIAFLALIFVLICVEFENNLGATLTMIATGLVAWWFYDFNIFAWIYQNFHVFLGFIAAYLFMGAIWARGKWEFFIRAMKRDYLESGNGGKSTFYWRKQTQSIPPKIADNKYRFMLWLTYWPASMLWTLIDDPIRRLFSWIYRTMANSLQKSSDSVFSDVEIKSKK
jgi:cell division protein FtsW (lipid II flippase)